MEQTHSDAISCTPRTYQPQNCFRQALLMDFSMHTWAPPEPHHFFFSLKLTEIFTITVQNPTMQYSHTSSFCPANNYLQVQVLDWPSSGAAVFIIPWGNLGFTAEPKHANRCNRQPQSRQQAITKAAYSPGVKWSVSIIFQKSRSYCSINNFIHIKNALKRA